MSGFDWGWAGELERNSDGDVRGAHGGVGGAHVWEDGTDLQSLWGQGRIGCGEQSDSSLYCGGQATGQTFSYFHDPAKTGESGFWGGVRGPGVGIDTHATDSMTSVGFFQNMVSGSVGYRQVGESDHDRGVNVGVGAFPAWQTLTGGGGPPGGAGVRAHYGDADHDGRNEYGLGATIPWGGGAPFGLSADYVTETPILDGLLMTEFVHPVAGAALTGMGIGAKLDERYDLSDRAAGVTGTSGTRGAPAFYSDMSPFERQMTQTMDALFGD